MVYTIESRIKGHSGGWYPPWTSTTAKHTKLTNNICPPDCKNRYWQHTRNMIHTYFIKYLITEIGSWPPFNTTHRETHQWSYKTVIVNNTGQATRVLWGVFMWTVSGRRQEGCGVSRIDVRGWLATWTPTNTSRLDTGTCHWPASN